MILGDNTHEKCDNDDRDNNDNAQTHRHKNTFSLVSIKLCDLDHDDHGDNINNIDNNDNTQAGRTKPPLTVGWLSHWISGYLSVCGRSRVYPAVLTFLSVCPCVCLSALCTTQF